MFGWPFPFSALYGIVFLNIFFTFLFLLLVLERQKGKIGFPT